jgi:tetratricopeptide (TPR) repeat protein
MKKLFVIAVLLISIHLPAQVKHIEKSLTATQLNFACNFFDNSVKYIPPSAEGVKDEDAEKWMRGMINKIMDITGLQNRYQLRAMKNYNNCSAVCFNNNIGQERFIQFDKAFLEAFQKSTNNRWFVFGVLAHEIGHHLNGHSLEGIGSRPNKEIEADEFAGFVMKKMGATLAEAQGIFSFMNNTDGPPTHPVKAKRYEAIKRGWDKAAGKQSLETLSFNDADTKDFALRNLLTARKQFAAAGKMEYINRALELVPDYAEALSEKGLVFAEMKEYDSAFYYCNEAAKMEPQIGLLRLNLAEVLYKAGDLDNAVIYTNDAIFLKPAFAAAYAFKALLLLDKKQFGEAEKSCDAALAIRPDTNFELADILETKAIAMYELGRQKESEEYFEEAKKLNPLSLRIGGFINAKNRK